VLHVIVTVELGCIGRLKLLVVDLLPFDALEPWVAHNFLSIVLSAAKPMNRVLLKKLCAKVSRIVLKEFVIQFGVSILDVLVKRLSVLGEEGWQADEHLVDDRSEGPPVGGFSVTSTLQNFWRKVFSRSTKTFSVLMTLDTLLRKTKVSQLDVAITSHQDVLWLQVAIEHVH